MKMDLTEIVCIVDRSGSMDAIRTDAIGGYNSFIDSQKAEPGEARVTLVLFDHEYDRILDNVPIQQVPPLNAQTYIPRGSTALLDAIGRTIDDVGKRLANTPESERPATVIVSILTDGMENASTDYTRARIAEMIEHQRTLYSWEFIFLAANQDAISTARGISIPAASAKNFAATGEGVRAAQQALSQDVSFLRRRPKN